MLWFQPAGESRKPDCALQKEWAWAVHRRAPSSVQHLSAWENCDDDKS
jgi:hypothetical protein